MTKRSITTKNHSGRRSTTARWIASLFICTLTVIICSASAHGQASASARSLGMADSYLLLSSNCEAAALNPANLALPGRRNYSVKLVSFSAHVANNAFTFDDYSKYNGAYLSEADKDDILARIPAEGLTLDFTAKASAFCVQVGGFAFTTEALGGGQASLAKDPLELALKGNKIGEVVNADGSDGDGWSAAAFTFSHGRNIYRDQNREIAAGVSIKYLYGLYYYGIEGLDAKAVTLATGFDGEGGLESLSSEGGSGYAVDFGLAGVFGDYQVGLVCRNLLASINWSTDNTGTVYRFYFNNLTLDNASDDTVWVSDEYELPVSSFKSRPPLEMELGASRSFGRVLLAASLRQGFENTAFVSKNPRLALGLEYPLISLLDLRTGMAVGGTDDFSASVGIGANLGPVNIDAAYASSAQVVPWGGRGGQAAFSITLDL